MADAPRPLVVMGDLNASLWSPTYREMLRRSGLQDARRGFGPLHTQSRFGFHFLLGIPIDHCLVSDRIEVRLLRTGPALGSDHLALIVDIAF
jgi:endonuclease/exonuclease/phosphatase (EEP) superfamily protein YafD